MTKEGCGEMFSHVMVGSNDLDRAKSFYNKVLGTLGFEGEPIHNVASSGHSRLFYRHNGGTFCVTEPINGDPATAANGGTIGFQCDSPEQVKLFHDVAVANGGTSIENPPGLRNGSVGPVHLAYVRDPDGNKLCALHRPK
jgi:catechol 2,3-dioxygenase-like lactoylglutathione lyase family enzyme